MLTGIASSYIFDSNMEPHLHRTLGDIKNDPNVFGNLKNVRYATASIPPLMKIVKFTKNEGAELYTKEQIRDFYDSPLYESIVTETKKIEYPCCDNPYNTRKELKARDIVELALFPPVSPTRVITVRTDYKCKTHGNRQYFFPVFLIDGSSKPDLSLPLTLMDVLDMLTALVEYDQMDNVMLIDLLNAIGVEYSYNSAGGFNVSFYHHKDNFNPAYEKFVEFTPYGETLLWFFIAGWRAKSTRVLLSRIPIIKILMETMTAAEVLEYLRAGAANVRDVPKFTKAGITAPDVANAHDIGVTDPKLMKTIDEEGIDFGLMKELMSGSLSY